MTAPTSIQASTGVAWNGPVCGLCQMPFIGSHECSIEDLLRRSDELRDMALAKFKSLSPRPTVGPEDRTRSCLCRPENGGSGICGCILGGPKVTC